MNRLIIIGASGHGKVVADIARKRGYTDIIFLDQNPLVKECAGWPVLGTDAAADDFAGDLFVAIGDSRIRKRLMEQYAHRFFPALIHPSAVIADGVEIGEGSAVMAGAVINPGARIGRGAIVNTCSSVDHDCRIGDFCHISVGVHIAGTVVIGENTWVGIGAAVSNNVSICAGCMIGAGAVVVRDISEPGVYLGVPARKEKS